jgi:hypothetical protein
MSKYPERTITNVPVTYHTPFVNIDMNCWIGGRTKAKRSIAHGCEKNRKVSFHIHNINSKFD